MPKFSETSLSRLSSCHRDLQMLCQQAIQYIDFTVIEGHRPKGKQDRMVDEGKSQVRWPNSKHNSVPSRAVDIVPVEVAKGKTLVDWKDRERMTLLAGYMLGLAAANDIHLRWGGDWDMDGEVKDNRFDDLVHFELM